MSKTNDELEIELRKLRRRINLIVSHVIFPTVASVIAQSNTASGGKIIHLADPTDDQDVATKKYVDDTTYPGYKVYTAVLTQSSTGAPVATVLKNTLGGTIVWTYVSTGVYRGTLSNKFTSGKTWLITQTFAQDFSPGDGSYNIVLQYEDTNSVNVLSYIGVDTANDVLSRHPIEIRVYD